MRQIADLQKRWQTSARFHALHSGMSLEKEALKLGAGTVLAKRNHAGALVLDGEEARLLTLFAVAYGRPVQPTVLAKLRNASKWACAGDECMAAMQIALALPMLRDPSEVGRRLFIADGLMSDGVDPRDIWTALEFDLTPLDVLDKRYNSEEARVPAGSGRVSGEWTDGTATSDADMPATIAGRAAPWDAESASILEGLEGAADSSMESWLELLLEAGSRLAPPVAFLSTLLHSTPAGGEHREGFVPGRPDLYWTDEEGLLTVTRGPDGEMVMQAVRGPDGKFRVRQGPGLRRLLNEHSLVDPAKLPADDPRSSIARNEPQLCPEPPRLDAPQGKEKSWAYSDYMKDIINQPPTPPKFGYQLINPFADGAIVKYDDCQRNTAAMIEYKGPGYAGQLESESNREGITAGWLDQATRQIEASGGRPVRWYFAELPAFLFARKIFSKYPILRRIELVYMPPPEDE